jgi:23S rRNA pseudouridine2605 synthase
MHINKFLAQATGMSRRAADAAVHDGGVLVNGQPADTGQAVTDGDVIGYQGVSYTVDEHQQASNRTTVIFNKPVGFVVSRNGQGSRTIYDILPQMYQNLKPVGRLDKESSGLLLLTDDGDLANRLTHPSYQKIKNYEISLSSNLAPLHHQMISDHGIQLEDGNSQLQLTRLVEGDDKQWLVTMHEGRNRQIRRTFAGLGYNVTRLHRVQFGDYLIQDLASGKVRAV